MILQENTNKIPIALKIFDLIEEYENILFYKLTPSFVKLSYVIKEKLIQWSDIKELKTRCQELLDKYYDDKHNYINGKLYILQSEYDKLVAYTIHLLTKPDGDEYKEAKTRFETGDYCIYNEIYN